jgi:hypothetical protein
MTSSRSEVMPQLFLDSKALATRDGFGGVLLRCMLFAALARVELPCLVLDVFLGICAGCPVFDVGRLLKSTLSAGASTLFILVSSRAGCGDSSRFVGPAGPDVFLPLPSTLPAAEEVFLRRFWLTNGGVTLGGSDFESEALVLFFFLIFGLEDSGGVSFTSLLDRSVVHELTGFPCRSSRSCINLCCLRSCIFASSSIRSSGSARRPVGESGALSLMHTIVLKMILFVKLQFCKCDCVLSYAMFSFAALHSFIAADCGFRQLYWTANDPVAED